MSSLPLVVNFLVRICPRAFSSVVRVFKNSVLCTVPRSAAHSSWIFAPDRGSRLLKPKFRRNPRLCPKCCCQTTEKTCHEKVVKKETTLNIDIQVQTKGSMARIKGKVKVKHDHTVQRGQRCHYSSSLSTSRSPTACICLTAASRYSRSHPIDSLDTRVTIMSLPRWCKTSSLQKLKFSRGKRKSPFPVLTLHVPVSRRKSHRARLCCTHSRPRDDRGCPSSPTHIGK